MLTHRAEISLSFTQRTTKKKSNSPLQLQIKRNFERILFSKFACTRNDFVFAMYRKWE